MEIKNKKLREALDRSHLGLIRIWRDDGYFHIYSDDPEVGEILASLETTSIYVNRADDLTEKEWIREIENLLTDKLYQIWDINEQRERK